MTETTQTGGRCGVERSKGDGFFAKPFGGFCKKKNARCRAENRSSYCPEAMRKICRLKEPEPHAQ